MTETEAIRCLDLFGGIGGFRLGLERASDRVEFVDYIEYDEHAVKSYNAIFDEEHEPRDATELETSEIPEHDILCAGFPCQSFSIAGERRGFEDTRGTLFFEIARIAREKLPQILLLENVKGLLNHADGETFKQILSTLDELGYDAEWQVLNSKYHGVPQNRERVFIIGHLRGESRPEIYPFRGETGGASGEDEREAGIGLTTRRDDAPRTRRISTAVDKNYWKGIDNHGQRTMVINNQLRPEDRPSIQDGQSGGSGILYNEDYSYTLANSPHYVRENTTIRKLTPKECWRLQGFPDWAFEAAQECNSDTQLYRQAGNSVTVDVVELVGSRIIKLMEAKEA